MTARRWLLCAEDVLSATLAKDLCDRVIHERAPQQWLRDLWDPAMVHVHREWVGVRPDFWWADRTAMDRMCEDLRIPIAVRELETGRRIAPHGKATMAFKAARIAQAMPNEPELLVLAGDTDGATDATMYFQEGVRLAELACPAVCANIHRESEAWVISGFVAQNPAERAALEQLTSEFGFDPTVHAERLLSNVSGDARDAKRVARLLFEPSGGFSMRNARVQSCWQDTPLDLHEERGQRTGLSAYLRDVEQVVVTLLSR